MPDEVYLPSTGIWVIFLHCGRCWVVGHIPAALSSFDLFEISPWECMCSGNRRGHLWVFAPKLCTTWPSWEKEGGLILTSIFCHWSLDDRFPVRLEIMPPAALVEYPAPPAPAQVSNRSIGCRGTLWRSAALPEGAPVAPGAGRAASISHTNSLAHPFPHSHSRSFTHSFIHSQGRSLILRAPAESSLCAQPSPESWGHAVNIPRACFTCVA